MPADLVKLKHWIEATFNDDTEPLLLRVLTGCGQRLEVNVVDWIGGRSDVTYDVREVACAHCLSRHELREAEKLREVVAP